MQPIIIILHVLIALAIIALVLIQNGKGADVGAAFGSGASNTVFGSAGNTSFLFRLTAGLALLFFITNIYLNYRVTVDQRSKSTVLNVMKTVPTTKAAAPKSYTLNIPQTKTTTKPAAGHKKTSSKK